MGKKMRSSELKPKARLALKVAKNTEKVRQPTRGTPGHGEDQRSGKKAEKRNYLITAEIKKTLHPRGRTRTHSEESHRSPKLRAKKSSPGTEQTSKEEKPLSSKDEKNSVTAGTVHYGKIQALARRENSWAQAGLSKIRRGRQDNHRKQSGSRDNRGAETQRPAFKIRYKDEQELLKWTEARTQ